MPTISADCTLLLLCVDGAELKTSLMDQVPGSQQAPALHIMLYSKATSHMKSTTSTFMLLT
jgi:hypothetical protein